VIAPTENDWQTPPANNHVLLEGINSSSNRRKYTLIVSTENSPRLEDRVSVIKPDIKGNVVKFSQQATGSAFNARGATIP